MLTSGATWPLKSRAGGAIPSVLSASSGIHVCAARRGIAHFGTGRPVEPSRNALVRHVKKKRPDLRAADRAADEPERRRRGTE
jgi:hypothetical protein